VVLWWQLLEEEVMVLEEVVEVDVDVIVMIVLVVMVIPPLDTV